MTELQPTIIVIFQGIATNYSKKDKHPRRVVENYDETPKAGSGVAANTQK